MAGRAGGALSRCPLPASPHLDRAVAAAALLALGAAIVGCSRQESPEAPIVLVSVAPQAWLVDRIAGDLVRVEIMVPAGANPATYEPTLTRLEAISQATLYLKLGHPHFPFERTWLDRLLSENRGLVAVDTTVGMGTREGDPHVWLAPRWVRAMAAATAASLVRALPVHAEALWAGLAAVSAEIDVTDAEIRAALAGRRGSRFFVYHPAWGHFADEYGLVQVAIEQEGRSPDPRQLAAFIELARAAGAKEILVQPQFDRTGASVVAQEIGATLAIADPLAYEWSDNLRHVAGLVARSATP